MSSVTIALSLRQAILITAGWPPIRTRLCRLGHMCLPHRPRIMHAVRSVSGAGEVRYALGERFAGRYLELVAGRCRPNTLQAVAFDLKTFFTVIPKDPAGVTAADVFEFLADQRGDRTVVRLADRES